MIIKPIVIERKITLVIEKRVLLSDRHDLTADVMEDVLTSEYEGQYNVDPEWDVREVVEAGIVIRTEVEEDGKA